MSETGIDPATGAVNPAPPHLIRQNSSSGSLSTIAESNANLNTNSSVNSNANLNANSNVNVNANLNVNLKALHRAYLVRRLLYLHSY